MDDLRECLSDVLCSQSGPDVTASFFTIASATLPVLDHRPLLGANIKPTGVGAKSDVIK